MGSGASWTSPVGAGWCAAWVGFRSADRGTSGGTRAGNSERQGGPEAAPEGGEDQRPSVDAEGGGPRCCTVRAGRCRPGLAPCQAR